jgi:hypothetical protein
MHPIGWLVVRFLFSHEPAPPEQAAARHKAGRLCSLPGVQGGRAHRVRQGFDRGFSRGFDSHLRTSLAVALDGGP